MVYTVLIGRSSVFSVDSIRWIL